MIPYLDKLYRGRINEWPQLHSGIEGKKGESKVNTQDIVLVFIQIVFVQIVTWLLKLLKTLDKGQISLKVLGYTLSFRQLFCSLILANHFRWLNKYVCVIYGNWTLVTCLCFHRGNSFDSRRFCQGPEILQICWQCFAVWRCEHCCAESRESPQVTDDRQRMMPLSAGFIICT